GLLVLGADVALSRPASASSYNYDGALKHARPRSVVDQGPALSLRSAGTRASPSGGTVPAFAALVVAAEAESTASDVGQALTKYEPYPPEALADRGFLGSWSTEEELQPGSVLSRYGRPGGTFVSPEGTPFAARGLPPSYEAF